MAKALVLVDFQNDFLQTFKEAKKLKKPILAKLSSFEGDLIFLKDEHGEDYQALKESLLFPKHCEAKSEGAKMPCEFELFKKAKLFHKNSFGSLSFANYLSSKAYSELHFCGLLTHICVLNNIILANAALPKASIKLHTKLCFSDDKSLAKYAIAILKAQGVEILA